MKKRLKTKMKAVVLVPLLPKTYGPIKLPGWDKQVIENPANIIRVEANNKNCIIVQHEVKDNLFPTMSLKAFETNLDPAMFYHAHRKHNINFHHGKSYKYVCKEIIATMSDGFAVPVSRQRVAGFETMVKNFPNFLLE